MNDFTSNGGVLALLAGMMMTIIVVGSLVGLFFMICQWKIFSKAGEPGWAAIIPIYNAIIFFKIIGKPWWWIFMYLIPIVNIVFAIWTVNMLSKSFGKDEGFTVGLILLGFIFIPILGYGSAQYQGPYGDPVLFKEYQDRKNNNGFDFENNRLQN